MKELLLLALVCVVSVLIGLCVYHPVIEEYGVATIQYDENADTYFIEVTERYEVEPVEGIKAGMPISYYQTDASSRRVSSKFETREMVITRIEQRVCSAGITMGVIMWCIGALFVLVHYLQKKRSDARHRKL